MGLLCRINRGQDGRISVLNPDGQPSTLYQGLVRYFTNSDSNPGAQEGRGTQVVQEETEVYNREVFRGRYLDTPTGELTNLTNKQWLLSRTPSFISRYGNWLSGSTDLALDQNREPIFSNISNQELDSIRQQAEADGSYLRAPNGSQSNLDENQWAMVRTQAFKQWFGDWQTNPEESSQFLDQNGEPKVFYHGTNQQFSQFDNQFIGTNTDAGWLGRGFYFYGVESEAQQYGATKPYFLRAQDVYVATDEENRSLAEENSVEASTLFTRQIAGDGYDGVYYNGNLREEAMIMDSSQIWDIENTVVGLNEQEVRESLNSEIDEQGAENRALLLWGLANTQEFQDNYAIDSLSETANPEPTAEQVLDFYRAFGDGQPMTTEDLSDIRVLAGSTELTLDQVIAEQIEQDPDPLVKKYNSTLLDDEVIPVEKSSIVEKIVSTASQTPILGITPQQTETDIFNALDAVYLERVSGEEDIVNYAPELPGGIAESVVADPTLQRQLFNYYVNLEAVPHYRLENGQLSEVQDTRVRDTLTNIILQNYDSSNMVNNLRAVLAVDQATWNNLQSTVHRLLRSVEQQAVDMNLDIVGMANVVVQTPYQQSIDYLLQLHDFLELQVNGVATLEDLNAYVNAHNQFFGISEETLTTTLRNTDGIPMMVVEGEVNEQQAFESQRVVRLFDNVYTVVDADAVYEQLLYEGSDLVPQYLYEGTDLGSPILQDRLNMFFMRGQYGQSFDSPLEQVKYNMARYLFTQQYGEQSFDFESEVSKLADILEDSDTDYLTTDFVSDFYNYILNQKQQGSDIYNRLLKYFYVDDQGLQVRGDIPSLKQELANWIDYIPYSRNLFDYAATTGNASLNQIMDFYPSGTMSEGELLGISAMNPQIVPNLTNNPYSTLVNGNIRVSRYAGDVTKIGNQLYKIVDRTNNIYSPNLAAMTVKTTPDYQSIVLNDPTTTTLLSVEEQQAVDQRIDDCN